jgi:glycosyltransferase involved in cell wall biosynthesis
MLSIIMPAYNEEKRIGKTLSVYSTFFKNVPINYEILVVINGTTDRTVEVVKKAQLEDKNIYYLNLKKGGKGYAIMEGFKSALQRNNKIIGFVDADLATSPEAFYELARNTKNYDVVIGSRWMKNSIIETPQTILRIITSRGFNFLVRSILFLPYSDTQCGAKVFRRKALEDTLSHLGTTEWAFDIDLLFQLKRKKYKIKEHPTTWKDNRDTKLNLKITPFKMFSSLIRLRLKHSLFNFIVRLYDKLPDNKKIHNW